MVSLRQRFLLHTFIAITALIAVPLIDNAVQAKEASKNACLQIGVPIYEGPMRYSYEAAYSVVAQAYDLIDELCIEPVYLPSKRIRHMLQNGSLDGEVARINTGDSNTVIVPTALANVPGTFVERAPFKHNVQKPEDLKGLLVAYPLGHVWAETIIRENGAYPVTVRNPDILLLENSKDRFDGFLIGDVLFYTLSLDKDVDPAEYKVSSSLGSFPVYHVLNKKHEDKIDVINQAFITLFKDKDGIPLYKAWIKENVHPQIRFCSSHIHDEFFFTKRDTNSSPLPSMAQKILKIANLEYRKSQNSGAHPVSALENGLVDLTLVDPLWISSSRTLESGALSDPLFEIEYIMIHAKNVPPADSVDVIAEQNVGVIYSFFGKDVKDYSLRRYRSGADMMDDINSGLLDYAIIERHYFENLAATGDYPKVFSGGIYERSNLHFLVSRNISGYMGELNEAIETFKSAK